MTEKRFVSYFDKDHNYIIQDLQNEDEYQIGFVNCDEDVFLKLVNKIADENKKLKIFLKAVNEELDLANRDCDTLEEENEKLKSTIAQLIEQNRKNNDLLLSDIIILEKALWCDGCENDYGRLKELRKELME